MFYIQSISNKIKSINSDKFRSANRTTIYVIENKGIIYIKNFEMIKIEDLEKIVMGLPKKKGTEERITSDILEVAFCLIKEEFVDIVNDSLRENCCPENWKTSTTIPIPKIKKN